MNMMSNTTPIKVATPGRRDNRHGGSYNLILTTTPCKKQSRSSLRRTPSAASSAASTTPSRTASGNHITTPSPSPAADRYIPNRSNMNIGLIGSSLREAEKRRLEITPKVYEHHRQRALGRNSAHSNSSINISRINGNTSGAGDDTNVGNTLPHINPMVHPDELHSNGVSSSASSSSTRQTDEMAFRRTMGAILHDTPLDEFDMTGSNGNYSPRSATNSYHSSSAHSQQKLHSHNSTNHTPSGLWGIVHPNLKTNVQKAQEDRRDIATKLAYASVTDLEEEVINENRGFGSSSAIPNSTTSIGATVPIGTTSGPKSVFSYGTPLQQHDSRRNIRPRMIDPYQHNHHKVIQLATSQQQSNQAKPMMMMDDDSSSSSLFSKHYSKRKISEKPTKVLDAPDIVDDYYLNLISWNKDNILAVAMGPSVYVWNASNGHIAHVTTLERQGDYVSSVSWSTIPGCTKYLAIGTHSHEIQLWDTEAEKCVRKLRGHTNRVGSLAWNDNKRWLTSGGRDSQILQHDVRCRDHVISSYRGHSQEVCGLAWNDDGHQLASGGNENLLCIWDAAMSQHRSNGRRSTGGGRWALGESISIVKPREMLNDHKAAVKALAWCPFNRGLLASGGGSADRCIKFWNTVSGSLSNSIDTGSQVCSLIWSTHQKEILSSHGFSENQLILWKYPTMTKIQEFKSHSARVLGMQQSPDGRSVVSVGADETLRFWDVFGPPPSQKRRSSFLVGDFQCPGAQTIR